MKERPLIGFHWGPFMNKALLEKYAVFETRKLCRWKNVSTLLPIYDRSKLHSGFWKETFDRLVLEDYKVDNNKRRSSCPWHKKKFKNHMWLPTSKQMQELLGLEYRGQVCADDFEKCKKKIDARWIKGTRIVVGDKVYISQGHI